MKHLIDDEEFCETARALNEAVYSQTNTVLIAAMQAGKKLGLTRTQIVEAVVAAYLEHAAALTVLEQKGVSLDEDAFAFAARAHLARAVVKVSEAESEMAVKQ